MKSAVALFVLLIAVWLLNSGHYTTMMIGFGIASCFFVVVLCRHMRIVDRESVPVHLLPRAVLYTPWLAVEVFKANIDVARRIVFGGRASLSPRVFDARTSQKSDLGRVLYANSITLTPGTVSIQVHGDAITVHAIAEEAAEELLKGEMDRRVTWLEGIVR